METKTEKMLRDKLWEQSQTLVASRRIVDEMRAALREIADLCGDDETSCAIASAALAKNPAAPNGHFCHTPEKCCRVGRCPRDPVCNN